MERNQAYAAGMSKDQVRAQVDAGRWRRVLPRVPYAGPPERATAMWAALLYAGEGATISHDTAAELWGLLAWQPTGLLAGQPTGLLAGIPVAGSQIHVAVPASRRVAEQPGLRIHYIRRLDAARHPTRQPPRTRVEATVLVLADAADRVNTVIGLVTRACQRGCTTPVRLGEALATRRRFRWRGEVAAILADVSKGANTPLELAYLRQVERAHGLPAGERQRHRHVGRGSQWLDVRYEPFGLIVELDGRVGHVDDGPFHDRRRDNYSTETGYRTLRYGWAETLANSCGVAAQVARVLHAGGWRGLLRSCPTCASVPARSAA